MKTRHLLIALLCFAGLSVASPLENGDRLSLSLESVPITKVLHMIAAQNGLNLVMSDQVTGDISVQLDSVDLRTALDAILAANGYTYVLRDNVVVIMSADKADGSDLDSRVVTLKYIDPITAKMALESRKSIKGQIIVLDKTEAGADSKASGFKPNRLMITDYPSIISEMIALVDEMDQPERIILIEAKIVETQLDRTTQLGFLWPSQVSAKLTGAEDGTSSTSYGSTNTRRSAGTLDLESGRWTWGKLSVDQLNAVLEMLEQDGHSKLLSDPRITTVENHEAEIKIATVIPIQTINRFTEAAATQDIVTFQDEEVGISLKVTPRINGDGFITIDVQPTVEDIIGYTGPAGNQKPITASRSIRTRVTVKDGETVALGGLLKEDEISNTQRIPILGHIPLLGSALFSNKHKEKATTDLIILITPHVL